MSTRITKHQADPPPAQPPIREPAVLAALGDALDKTLRAHTFLREGTPDDYARLARHHYHPRVPATIVRSLVVAHARSHEPIGILTVSMPTLNGAWRDAFARADDPRDSPSPASRARRLNRSLRTISRVIVEPRHRARGVATALVRAYLAHPLTPHTEAVAAMGAACRFFARAGMREIHAPRPRRDVRLAGALEQLRIPPWALADPHRARRLAQDERLARALRAWAGDARATRALAGHDPAEIAPHAAAALIARRSVYIHSRAPGSSPNLVIAAPPRNLQPATAPAPRAPASPPSNPFTRPTRSYLCPSRPAPAARPQTRKPFTPSSGKTWISASRARP